MWLSLLQSVISTAITSTQTSYLREQIGLSIMYLLHYLFVAASVIVYSTNAKWLNNPSLPASNCNSTPCATK